MEIDNKERNLRKKLKNLEIKEKSEEIYSKINKIKHGLGYYDNIRKIREQQKSKIKVKVKTSDEFLDEAYKENHKFWEEAKKNQDERKKNQDERKKNQYERKKKNKETEEEYYEEVKSLLHIYENKEKICNQIKQEFNIPIPINIKDFISNPFNKVKYHKLVKEYHPDKKKYESKLCELFTQLINEHKT